jgi:hypothetical protein
MRQVVAVSALATGTETGDTAAEVEMSRDPPQRRGAARETALPLTARRPLFFAGMQGAQARRDRGGAS